MELKQDNSFKYWFWFASNKQEELFEVINSMIESKVKEFLPQLIDEYLRTKLDRFSFDIQTTINGKTSANIRDAITEMIVDELNK